MWVCILLVEVCSAKVCMLDDAMKIALVEIAISDQLWLYITGLLLLSLVCSLVAVHSQQTFPYVPFMGETLANHSSA